MLHTKEDSDRHDVTTDAVSSCGQTLIRASEAMRLLGLSRHNFEKCVARGLIHKIEAEGPSLYGKEEVEDFKDSAVCRQMVDGVVDRRNKLNDLTGKEWVPETKSYMYQKGLGASHPHAQIEIQHPAPFSFQNIECLVRFFTKKGMSVLDPFGGVGSTAKACELLGRTCTSIELSEKYHKLSLLRLETEVGTGTSAKHRFINGDSVTVLPQLPEQSIDFVVTSPPYWGILHKQDQKVRKNRVANNLDTQYSDDPHDLGNIADYGQFLDVLCDKVLMPCARVLRTGKYVSGMLIIMYAQPTGGGM